MLKLNERESPALDHADVKQSEGKLQGMTAAR
jgi:hypothetical protein